MAVLEYTQQKRMPEAIGKSAEEMYEILQEKKKQQRQQNQKVMILNLQCK